MTKVQEFLEILEYNTETSYKGFKLVHRGMFLVALNDDGFVKYEVPSSMGLGGYTRDDVDRLKKKIDKG